MSREHSMQELSQRRGLDPRDRVPVAPHDYAVCDIKWASQTQPVVLTAHAHGFSEGDRIFVTGVQGMEALNDRTFTVGKTKKSTFELVEADGTRLSAYISGGKAIRGRVEYATLEDLRAFFQREPKASSDGLEGVSVSDVRISVHLDGECRSVSLDALFRAFSENAAARD